MEQDSVMKTKARTNVSEPEGINFFKGLTWIEGGIVGISFLFTSIPIIWRMPFCVAGIICFGIGLKWIGKYVATYHAFRQFVPKWDSERGMYDVFAQELNAWHQEERVPTCCDGDTLYFLRLQKERLKKKGIRMTDRVMPAKGTGYGTATLPRKSLWYTADMVYESINRTIRFDNMQGTVYEREVEQVMYEMIVHTPNDMQYANITMTCPNCGAVSQVAELEEGCKYCGTKFRITDLFPRVVNLFFLKDKTTATLTGMAERTILCAMFAVFAALFPALFFYR